MSKFKIKKKAYIDFKPAKIKQLKNDDWRVVFYVKKPGTNEMKRFRRRVTKMPNLKERMKYAKILCEKINGQLENGWSPFLDTKKEYTYLIKVLEKYLDQNKQLVQNKQIRPATESHYASIAIILLRWIKHQGKSDMLCSDFNRQFVTNYLDYIFFEKKRSARTTNNTLGWCILFGNFMVDRGYIPANTVRGIPKKRTETKKREVIDSLSRKEIFTYFEMYNKEYLTLCLLVFYCFIRRTEMTKLKVQDVILSEGIILVSKDVSKNKKTETVTIPQRLYIHLERHINNAKQADFLFSNNKFLPGPIQIKPKKISDTWAYMRKKIELKKTYQLYSLKDTGITELFKMNVPLIKIRDQARHYDIKITETYTPRNYSKDETIAQIEFSF